MPNTSLTGLLTVAPSAGDTKNTRGPDAAAAGAAAGAAVVDAGGADAGSELQAAKPTASPAPRRVPKKTCFMSFLRSSGRTQYVPKAYATTLPCGKERREA